MTPPPIISLMLAVADAPAAVAWYQRALGARLLWSVGSVARLEVGGAPFVVAEPAANGWDTAVHLGMPSARVEVFCDDPDTLIARAASRPSPSIRRRTTNRTLAGRRSFSFVGRSGMHTTETFLLGPSWAALLSDLGIDRVHVLRRAGLPEDLTSRGSVALSPEQYFRLWLAITAEANDPALAVRIGQTISSSSSVPEHRSGSSGVGVLETETRRYHSDAVL